MQIQVLLNSSHVFPRENLNLDELLIGIPSKVIIAILCSINASIYHKEESLEEQIKILEGVFLYRQPSPVCIKNSLT